MIFAAPNETSTARGGAAVWDIFPADATDAIRQFLRESTNYGIDDPVLRQLHGTLHFLGRDQRRGALAVLSHGRPFSPRLEILPPLLVVRAKRRAVGWRHGCARL